MVLGTTPALTSSRTVQDKQIKDKNNNHNLKNIFAHTINCYKAVMVKAVDAKQ